MQNATPSGTRDRLKADPIKQIIAKKKQYLDEYSPVGLSEAYNSLGSNWQQAPA